MAVNNKVLARLVYDLSIVCPVPDGFMYRIESNGGHGGPRFWSLSIVRTDYQGGEFVSIPGMGGLQGSSMFQRLLGMIDGLELKERIAKVCR